ncbi:MAG: trehalose-phosphatase [Myxococcales bacterium]
MKDVFSSAGRRALEEMALSNVLLAFDYDGTLAPLVPRPDKASLRASTRMLLARVASAYPCAVVSGRARADVARRLADLPFLRIVGNHGAEWEGAAPPIPRAVVGAWRRKMARACAALPGVEIEDKTFSLSVHWRRARDKRSARASILEAAGRVESARIIHGKDVVSIVHADASHKGDAVVEIGRQLGCDTAIYVGDDVTDEDVFMLGRPGRLLTVRVGRGAGSRAHYFLADQAKIDHLLALLFAFRRGVVTLPRWRPRSPSIRSRSSSSRTSTRPRTT